jgi:hypothetical protein
LLIQNTPIKFQSNFIRNTHKIKQLRLYSSYRWWSTTSASSETKEDCSWNHFAAEDGHHKWFVYSHCQVHVTASGSVSTNSGGKKMLDYPTLNSTCRCCCWHFCHQSIHQRYHLPQIIN